MNLNTLATRLGYPGTLNTEITGICIDSRILKPGNLFIAIQGERFDGHDFVQEASTKGAAACIVKRAFDGLDIPQFVVNDPLVALAEIAAVHRQEIHCPIIALTGSNGKTTVKEMIAAILPQPSLATKGNLNNHIGVPLSVLMLNKQHRYAVFELGANHPSEIAQNVKIVQPDVTLINNIAPAHIEGFGSIEGVARAKGELHEGLASSGTAVINDDDAYAHFWDDLIDNRKILRFSIERPMDIYAERIAFNAKGCAHFLLKTPAGTVNLELQVPGLHNVRNALAAASCCVAVGVSIEDIERGLRSFTGVKGRMSVLLGKNQSTIIDDTYNANLRSVITALEVLSTRPGKKIFIFGDMGELGEWAIPHHHEVGLTAQRLGIDQLFTCGTHSFFTAEAFGVGGQHCVSQKEIVQKILSMLGPETTVLVKGSRSSEMERIVSQLLG